MAKLPLPPTPAQLRAIGADLVDLAPGTYLWRLHRLAGAYPAAWNEMRGFGPLKGMRFDPHAEPQGTENRPVTYAASDVPSALAEMFQESRTIDPYTDSPQLSAWTPSRTLRVLDLTGTWPLRAGASHTINTGPKRFTRAWSRAITEAWPNLDGMAYTSSMSSHRCWVLYSPALDAFPSAPDFTLPLSAPSLRGELDKAAASIRYYLL